MNKISLFVERLRKIGIEVELVGNFPWIYLDKVNGKKVTERFMARHGFTAFMLSVRPGNKPKWSDIRKVFSKVRELASKNYDNKDTCVKCGSSNKVTATDCLESVDILEADTECSSCGHKDHWVTGHYESLAHKEPEMKFIKNNWVDFKENRELYGIDVVSDGVTMHVSEGDKPLFFESEKDRDNRLEELNSDI
jgi:hypothetical protein